MIILDVNKLSKDFGYGKLFDNISFSLTEGESISIVGPNGCGKSTLLKLIAGLEKIDSGQVSIKKGAKVGYLDQIGSSVQDERIVRDYLRDSFAELRDMEKEITRLQEKMESDLDAEEYNKTLVKYCNVMEKYSTAGGYDIETEINTVVEGLAINKDLLNQSYNDLSGGEKTLIQLARALLIKPELLLLDEPTNHLDIGRIEWLEQYIKSFKGASVIVSHDRYFLDRMSNKILDLDDGIGKVYTTNYTGFLEEKEKELEKQLAEYKDQQALIKKLEAEKKYFAERGMATNSSTLTNRAHVLQNRIDRLKAMATKRPKQRRKLNVEFDEERKTSKKVISVEELTVVTPEKRIILDNISLGFYSGERVALIGENGSGKSTLLKTILGQQELESTGTITIGPSIKIGYLPQIITFTKADQKLLEYFEKAIGESEEKARRILSAFQFYQEDVNKRVGSLSGGERMKIKLAELLQQKINTLIFDEPTNHIDIPTKEVLEDAIDDFEGTLIFVSHDRYFINKFADRTVEFENGKVTTYLGGYDDYKEKKNQLLKANEETMQANTQSKKK